MTEYEIEINDGFYEDGGGKTIIINDRSKTVSIVDRTGDEPHDLVNLHVNEISEVVKILTDFLSSHLMRPFGSLPEEYDRYEK